MSRLRAKGFTVIEVLIFSGLSVLILGLAVKFFTLQNQVAQKVEAQNSLTLSSVLSLRALHKDLNIAEVRGVKIAASGQTIAIRRVLGARPNGDQIWDDDLVFFWLEEQKLLRGQLPSADFGPEKYQVPDLTEEQFQNAVMSLTSSKNYKMVAQNIETLRLSQPLPREIEIELELSTPFGEREVKTEQKTSFLLMKGDSV